MRLGSVLWSAARSEWTVALDGPSREISNLVRDLRVPGSRICTYVCSASTSRQQLIACLGPYADLPVHGE
jgi:hypothetical protein